MLLGGNHESEKSVLNAEVLKKAMYKEVEHIWALPLTIESIYHIKNSGVVLLGVSEQLSINNKVERYTKRLVTHYCSFLGPPGLSINNRVLRDTPGRVSTASASSECSTLFQPCALNALQNAS